MRTRTATLSLSAALLIATTASAQTTTPTTPPPTQDSQLRALLGLGDATGCTKLLGITTNDQSVVSDALKTVKFGKELRAICGPSAVNSASSLSGGINTVQATKSTSTFRPRPRPQSKRPTSPRRAADLAMFGWRDPSSSGLQFGGEQEVGAGVFGGIQRDTLTRNDTAYESGYTSTVTGFTGGVDYRQGGTIAGGWFGKTNASADFTRFGALFSGPADAAATAFLASPANLATVCGGISTAGGFEDRTTHLGGFVGSAVGGSGFVEGAVGWSRLNHDYARSVCAIEATGNGLRLGTVNGKQVLQDGNGNQLDDIFAGTISGLRIVRELNFSVGAGGDFGNEFVSFAPHAELTVRRANSDAYAETGQSTVMGIEVPNTGTGVVTDNNQNAVTLTLGGPTGLELAFDAGTRTSIVLESGGALSVRVGHVVPYAGGYWRREFRDQFYVVSARMAEDLRTTPTTFTFGNDAFDRDSLVFKFGCTVTGQRGGLRFEWAMNQRDVLFDTHTLSAHALIVF